MVALFDHEEVGSQSAHGAGSNLLESAMRRILAPHANRFDDVIHRSFLVSADCAHACHPNYADKHEASHQPTMNGGLVIKHNANQRYATSARTSALMRAVAARAHAPVQAFVVRNDGPCGSTIGPMLSASTGIRAVGKRT